jgi:16S rRNA G966 N2-methylase RsmD
LSRDSAEVVYCEKNRNALQTIRRNLEATGLAERARVVGGDAFAYLARPDLQPFDVIYIAPPQYKGMWLKALQLVDARPELLNPDGFVIVQIFPKEWTDVALTHLVETDRRQYGSTALHFLQLRSDAPSSEAVP